MNLFESYTVDMNYPEYFSYWGKARYSNESENKYHPLVYHSLDVAAVGKIILERNYILREKLALMTNLDDVQLVKWTVFILSLHDIGKFSHSFQSLRPDLLNQLQGCERLKNYPIRHDSLGYIVWDNFVRDDFQKRGLIKKFSGSKWAQPREPIDLWIGAVVGHHGEPPKLMPSCILEDYFSKSDLCAIRSYIDELVELFLGENISFPEFNNSSINVVSWWLSGLAVLCDWLGSNTKYFPYRTEFTLLIDYWEIASRNAREIIQASELYPKNFSSTLTIEDLIKSNSEEKIEPTHMQDFVSKIKLKESPYLFILEDVTGTGKTEASVLLAHKLIDGGHGSGLYFALPTMATADSMYRRMSIAYRKLYSNDASPSLILAHGARDVSSEFRQTILASTKAVTNEYNDGTTAAESHCNAWLVDNRKKALLADIGVGTIDQALLSILPVRHQSLRLLGLMNKILIVDEIHACDAYMHELLCSLLRAHASSGGSAILLSATLTQKQRQSLLSEYAKGQAWNRPLVQKTDILSFPLVSELNYSGLVETKINVSPNSKRDIEICFLFSEQDVESLLENVIESNQCACWIRNTVVDAIEAFKCLKARHPEWKIELFHARYALGDRLAIEKRTVERFDKESTARVRRGRLLIATQVVEQSLDLDFDTLVTDLSPVDLIIQRAGRLRRHSRDSSGNPILGKDQRGAVVLHILSPKICKAATANWYSEMFPRAQWVYPIHGQLWLTAQILAEKSKIQVPGDIRSLIEGVYSEGSQLRIPKPLLDRSLDAESVNHAEASIASLNAIQLDAGYVNIIDSDWWNEGETPTRLGEKTKLVYLAKWYGNELIPWIDVKYNAWSLSAVSVRSSRIDRETEAYMDSVRHDQIKKCKEQLPAKGRWGVLLPLTQESVNVWAGVALNEQQSVVRCEYSSQFGLTITN